MPPARSAARRTADSLDPLDALGALARVRRALAVEGRGPTDALRATARLVAEELGALVIGEAEEGARTRLALAHADEARRVWLDAASVVHEGASHLLGAQLGAPTRGRAVTLLEELDLETVTTAREKRAERLSHAAGADGTRVALHAVRARRLDADESALLEEATELLALHFELGALRADVERLSPRRSGTRTRDGRDAREGDSAKTAKTAKTATTRR